MGPTLHNKRFTIKEIIKIVATRCHILRLKCTKTFVGRGSAPDPAGGAYRPPSWILGGLLRRGKDERRRERREGEGRVGKGKEGKGEVGTGEGQDGKGGGSIGPKLKFGPI